MTTLGGERFRYDEIWQRKNLVLLMLPQGDATSREYLARLMALVPESNTTDTCCTARQEVLLEVEVDSRQAEPRHRADVGARERWGQNRCV